MPTETPDLIFIIADINDHCESYPTRHKFKQKIELNQIQESRKKSLICIENVYSVKQLAVNWKQ